MAVRSSSFWKKKIIWFFLLEIDFREYFLKNKIYCVQNLLGWLKTTKKLFRLLRQKKTLTSQIPWKYRVFSINPCSFNEVIRQILVIKKTNSKM